MTVRGKCPAQWMCCCTLRSASSHPHAATHTRPCQQFGPLEGLCCATPVSCWLAPMRFLKHASCNLEDAPAATAHCTENHPSPAVCKALSQFPSMAFCAQLARCAWEVPTRKTMPHSRCPSLVATCAPSAAVRMQLSLSKTVQYVTPR